MDFTIRPATTADYPIIAAIGWRATADFGLSVADLEFADRMRTPATIAKRVVAVNLHLGSVIQPPVLWMEKKWKE